MIVTGNVRNHRNSEYLLCNFDVFLIFGTTSVNIGNIAMIIDHTEAVLHALSLCSVMQTELNKLVEKRVTYVL